MLGVERGARRAAAGPSRLQIPKHDVRRPKRPDWLVVEHRMQHHAAERHVLLDLRGGIYAGAIWPVRRRFGQPSLPADLGARRPTDGAPEPGSDGKE